MRASLGLLALVVTSSSACFTELSGVKVKHDGGGNADGGSTDDGSTDGGGTSDGGGTGSDLATADKSCPLPHLQVLVRDGRSTSGLVKHGQVLRLPLDGSPACAPLVVAESLPPDPTALGFFPPTKTTLYGEADGRVRFLAQDDTEQQAPYDPGLTNSPDYLFYVGDDVGDPRLVVAYDSSNDPLLGTVVTRLDVLDKIDWSQRTHRWTFGVDTGDLLRLTSVYSVGTDPRNDLALLAFQYKSPDDPTVSLVPPWTGAPSTPTAYLAGLDNPDLPKRMRTFRSSDGTARVAWIFAAPPNSPDDDRVVLRSEKSGSGPQQWGPVACTTTTLCSLPLKLYDAIPDFDEPGTVLASCFVDSSTVTNASTNHVIRIASDGTCTTLFRGDTLPPSHYLMRLVAAVNP